MDIEEDATSIKEIEDESEDDDSIAEIIREGSEV
jgi:hypothetical protein